MSDVALGYLVVGVLLAFIVSAWLFTRGKGTGPQVSDEGIRRARARDESYLGKDPHGPMDRGVGL